MIPKSILYLCMILYIIFGAGTTLIIKQMDLITIKDHKFAHPYIQCTNLFIGESLCLLTYQLYKSIKRKTSRVSLYQEFRRSSSKELPMLYSKLGILSFGIPGILYMLSTYLMFIGLVLSAASVYQIIRSILVLQVLIISLLFLKRRFYRHHYVGITLILIGVVIVGVDSILDKSSSSSDPVGGVIILIISQAIAGIVLVYEEYLMNKIYIEPIVAVGVEGLVGMLVSICILIILNFIPCTGSDFCYGGKVENTVQVLSDIFSNLELLFLYVSSLLVIAVLYWAGIYVTRYASALSRATLDSARIVLVWGFSIAAGWETFLWIELIGFCFVVFGTLVYNEVLIIPLFGLKESAEDHRLGEGSEV